MNFLRSAVAEIVGLFIDDWAFAPLLVAWVGLSAVFAPRLPPVVAALLFFLGLALLTLAFVARQARRLRSRSRD